MAIRRENNLISHRGRIRGFAVIVNGDRHLAQVSRTRRRDRHVRLRRSGRTGT
jgi:hypothetical protein